MMLALLHAVQCLTTGPTPTDGSQLVAGVGARVVMYDTAEGKLLHVLKGHKVRPDGCLQEHACIDAPNHESQAASCAAHRL